MRVKLFNLFASAYSEANTVISKSINKSLPEDCIESATIQAVVVEVSRMPLSLLGGNSMELFANKNPISGKTCYESMVILSSLEVVKEVMSDRGIELSGNAVSIASSVVIGQKDTPNAT